MVLSSIARPLLAAVAVANGMETLRDPKPKLEAAEGLLARIPANVNATLIVQADAAVKIAAGLLMGLGWAPRLAAIVLAVDLIPTTVVEHPFSATASPETRQARQANFLSNCGLLGGVLLAVAAPGSNAKSKRP